MEQKHGELNYHLSPFQTVDTESTFTVSDGMSPQTVPNAPLRLRTMTILLLNDVLNPVIERHNFVEEMLRSKAN